MTIAARLPGGVDTIVVGAGTAGAVVAGAPGAGPRPSQAHLVFSDDSAHAAEQAVRMGPEPAKRRPSR